MTDLDNTNPRPINEHNHPPNPPEQILATKALQEMKRIAKETKAAPQDILAEAVKGLDASILKHMPSKDSAKRSLRYLRTANAKKKEKQIVQYVNSEVNTQALVYAQQSAGDEPLDSDFPSIPCDNYAILAERFVNVDEIAPNTCADTTSATASSQIKVRKKLEINFARTKFNCSVVYFR